MWRWAAIQAAKASPVRQSVAALMAEASSPLVHGEEAG